MSAYFLENAVSEQVNNEAISDFLIRALQLYAQKKSEALVQEAPSFSAKEPPLMVSLMSLLGFSLTEKSKKTRIQRLADLLKYGAFGFLEMEDRLLEQIEQILRAQPITEEDAFAKEAINSLSLRVEYIRCPQKRTPDNLTADIKVLLIGDGWVCRSEESNPIVQRTNREPELKPDLYLGFRGYCPKQVYTVDRTFAQLADYTARIEDIPEKILPNQHFDIIYFEGMGFERQEALEGALKAVRPSLKESGLIFYFDVGSKFIMQAKSGEITKEKLAVIPECVKQSIARSHDINPLEDINILKKKSIEFSPIQNKTFYQAKP